MSICPQDSAAAKAPSTGIDTQCNSPERRPSRCPQPGRLRNRLDAISAISRRQVEPIDLPYVGVTPIALRYHLHSRCVTETKDENTKTKDLLIKYARDPNHAALFNYASAAHNNHFFFETLVHLPPFFTIDCFN